MSSDVEGNPIATQDYFPDEETEESVRVAVRIRPLNKRELLENETIAWNYNETSMLEETPNGQRVYSYDNCFGPASNNKQIYDVVGKPVVLKAMEGYNGTVFSYGQTGSGKTWTMLGCDDDPGMLILCIRDIIDWVESNTKKTFALKVSYFEVYNEEINDLLGLGKNLKIVSETPEKGAVIGGLVEEIVTTPSEFMEVLQRGENARSYASTSMNADSSRSHTIYRVAIECQDIVHDELSGKDSFSAVRTSFLNLVDLAGSERQKSTNATGKTLKEGANINKSLLALGAVINKLGEASKKTTQIHKTAKAVFIPYRDSKLTRILKNSLGGNTLTSVLCAVTPSPMHREETVSTLKFGQLCKTVSNTVKKNEIVDDKVLIHQYKHIITELREQLEIQSSGTGPQFEEAIKEKEKLEEKVRTLEELLLSGSGQSFGDLGLNETDVTSSLAGRGGGAATLTLLKGLNDAKAENAKLNEKYSELLKRKTSLENELADLNEFVEAKNTFDEYQREREQEIEDERSKLDKEKQALQSDRYKILNERSSVEEKERRLATVIMSIDEKDSKLRQTLSTLKEQQDQWHRSVVDLQRREDTVDDWQRNHHKQELKVNEALSEIEVKTVALNNKESILNELEAKMKVKLRELQEREQRLQVAMSRIADSEQNIVDKEENYKLYESSVRKREIDCDIKDKALSARWKELESLEALLREKERKMTIDGHMQEEKEENIKLACMQNELRQIELEKKKNELDGLVQISREKCDLYNSKIAEVELQQKKISDKVSSIEKMEFEFNYRESAVKERELLASSLDDKIRALKEKEMDINSKIINHKKAEDEFYSKGITEISSRHSKQMSYFESVIKQQTKLMQDLNVEVTQLKKDNEDLHHQNSSLIISLQHKIDSIEMLKSDLISITNAKQSAESTIDAMYMTTNASSVEAKHSSHNNNSFLYSPNNKSTLSIGSTNSSNKTVQPATILSELVEAKIVLESLLENRSVEESARDISQSSTSTEKVEIEKVEIENSESYKIYDAKPNHLNLFEPVNDNSKDDINLDAGQDCVSPYVSNENDNTLEKVELSNFIHLDSNFVSSPPMSMKKEVKFSIDTAHKSDTVMVSKIKFSELGGGRMQNK